MENIKLVFLILVSYVLCYLIGWWNGTKRADKDREMTLEVIRNILRDKKTKTHEKCKIMENLVKEEK